jgi:predicted transcriptional regulator
MLVVSLNLAEDDAKRLAELAAREGKTPEAVAAAAVRARLDADAASRKAIEVGLAELDAGAGMTLDAYEREMDGFMADLLAGRA